MVKENIMRDMDLAREVLSKTEYSIVVIKNGKILTKRRGVGIRPILEVIDELKNSIYGSIIGDRTLGKASALLCRYANAKGVYSPKATKTAIAILIIADIPSQIDKMVPYIKNRDGDDICPFEEMLKDVDSPDEAYNILKKKILK
jgi:hypothetical protein